MIPSPGAGQLGGAGQATCVLHPQFPPVQGGDPVCPISTGWLGGVNGGTKVLEQRDQRKVNAHVTAIYWTEREGTEFVTIAERAREKMVELHVDCV